MPQSVRRGPLPHDLVDRFVVPHAEQRGMAEAIVGRPLGEGDLHDVARHHPRGGALARGALRRRLRHDVLRQRVFPPDALFVRETSADLAGVAQLATVVHGEVQRADLLRGARRRVPADDNELLLVLHLDLQPFLRAARFVDRGAALGDDPLPPFPLRPRQRLRAGAVELFGDTHAGGRAAQDLGEEEDHLPRTLLQELEAWRPLIVECNDLAVEDDVVFLDLRQRRGTAREAPGQIDVVAAPDGELPAADGREGAEAVVLQLVDPAAVV